MPRRKKNRIVANPPVFSEFKPVGVRARHLEQAVLSLDEYEAVRLADHMRLSHAEAAERMEISRSTFTRLIEGARGKVADFLITGKLLCVKGGCVHFRENTMRCLECGLLFNTDFGNPARECPSCGSTRLADLAGGFGHGKCCFKNRFD